MLYTEEAIRKRKEKIIKLKKNIKNTIYIILLPLLIYNISLIFQAFITPNKTPSFFGIKTYVIISGSMLPQLAVGDIVVVNENYDILQKDDIISFRRGQAVITHRISEVIEEEGIIKYKTKGDNNNIQDAGSITVERVEGKVIAKIPFVGKFVLFLKNKITIISIVVIYYIYLLYDQSMQRRKDIRKIKRQEYENQKNEGRMNEQDK